MHVTEADAGVLLAIGVIAVLRRQHSAKWCRKNLVGPLRRFLEPPARHGAIPFRPEVSRAREVALKAVTSHCRACGACELARM